MYDFLEFIDSPDIREYNHDTEFTAAQLAVLVSRSQKKTIEEKIEALEYLVAYYPAETFSGIVPEYDEGEQETGNSIKEMVVRTIEEWKKILADRFMDHGYIYAAILNEKDHIQYDLLDYHFFSNYEKAYEELISQKQYYLVDEDLRNVELCGEILRIKLDHHSENFRTDCDRYWFDNELKMIQISGESRVIGDDMEGTGSIITDYIFYMPLPFREGDIVKVESPFHETFYGVFPKDWEKPERSSFLRMQVSLDQYDAKDKSFWYTDDTEILELSLCTEGLPEKEKVLKTISDVRKGKLDFFNLLYRYNDIENL